MAEQFVAEFRRAVACYAERRHATMLRPRWFRRVVIYAQNMSAYCRSPASTIPLPETAHAEIDTRYYAVARYAS